MTKKHLQVGSRLAVIRKERNLQQKDIGEILKLPWRTYQTWEMGTRQLSYENLMKFCRAFGVRPEWVMEGEKPVASFDISEMAGEIAQALALELERQDRGFSPEDWGRVTTKMVSSRIKQNHLNLVELANYVELVGKPIVADHKPQMARQ